MNDKLPVINVWYGCNQFPRLSNLYKRPFVYEGKQYISVEHAYQTWKSGEFYDSIYTSPWKCGSKYNGFIGNSTEEDRINLLYKFMKMSFDQNPKEMEYLKKTDGCIITHTQDTGIWKDVFPILLMQIRDELMSNKKTENTNMNKYNDIKLQLTETIKTFDQYTEPFLFEPLSKLPDLCAIIEEKTNEVLAGYTELYDYAVVVDVESEHDQTGSAIIRNNVAFKLEENDSFVYIPFRIVLSAKITD